MHAKHVGLLIALIPGLMSGAGTRTQTPYTEPKVLFDFYLQEPAQINSALYWIRSLMNPLMDDPYNLAPDFMDIIVVISVPWITTIISMKSGARV